MTEAAKERPLKQIPGKGFEKPIGKSIFFKVMQLIN
jgi:hypothetical protein